MKINDQEAISRPFATKAGKSLSDIRKEALFSEFHSLLSSGIDFSRTFEMLIKSEKNFGTTKLLENLYRNIVQGDSLSATMAKSKCFTALDSGVVRIGEETGKLNESLCFLSDYYRKKLAQKRMLSSATSYPIVIICTAVVVLVFMMTVIVPMFEQVYTRMGGELPWITKAVIAFAGNFGSYLAGVSIPVFLILALAYIKRSSDTVKSVKAKMTLGIPLVGRMMCKHYQAHFCKLMYLLNSSGVPLLYSMEIMKDIITFYPYRKSFDVICSGLHKGESFSSNVAKFENLYDHKLVMMLGIGEETNSLSDMLRRQGDTFSQELEHQLKQLGSMLEPILILFVGALVATVLISMYLPMFKLGTTIY